MTRAACLFADVLAVSEDAVTAALPSIRLPFEVPASVSPAVAGLVVGAVTGVLLFAVVLLVASRSGRKRYRGHVAAPYEVMRVPPYVTGSHHVIPPPSSSVPLAGPAPTLVLSRPLPVDPLARAGEQPAQGYDPEDGGIDITPIVAVGSEPGKPHPLGLIPSDSAIMRAASMADFDVDDSPTEIAETLFDEPPRPLQRGAAPRIRPVQPSPPRFSATSA